jgi:[amino group carrier protein]-L-2-aminoadipate 6-kinase
MTLVVKIGGGAGVATTQILQEIATLVRQGQRVVLLHGGSDLTNTLSEQLGHPTRTITSPSGMTSRYTDSETLRIFSMAVAGQINTDLVAQLQGLGINAFGMAGVDGRLLVARRKAVVRSVTPEGRVQILRDDYTGQIEQVNSGLLTQLLDAGYTPVIAPLALSHQGERLNVDGDRAAAAIAAALHAESLVIMTNVAGLLADHHDATTLIHRIPTDRLDDYMQYAQGRMRKKLLGAQEALQGGVARVCIGSTSLIGVVNGSGTVIAKQVTHAHVEQREVVSVGSNA